MGIKLLQGDSRTFDFKNNFNNTDCIFSTPPWFQKENITGFGINKEIFLGTVFQIFKRIYMELKPLKTLFIVSKYIVIFNNSKKVWKPKIRKEPLNLWEKNLESKWAFLGYSEAQYLISRYHLYNSETVLDPFCGTGNLLLNFVHLKKCKNLYGVDIDINHINIAKEKLNGRSKDS